MCVASLNVSTQPCNHRWIQLVRPCNATTNLANCPEKLRLEGWETRNETCPWCGAGDQAVHETTHRLFGGSSSSGSSPSSPISPEPGFTRTRRSGSDGTLSSLSRHSSSASVETERAQRHRDMNDRLTIYLTTDPHEVLPSAKKYYPSYTQPPSLIDDGSASDALSVRSSGSKLGKGWKKSVSFGKAMFKG